MENQRNSVSRKENKEDDKRYGSMEDEKGLGCPPIHHSKQFYQPLANTTNANYTNGSHLPNPMPNMPTQIPKKKQGNQPISFPKI
jgi:hypothetical protein